MTKYMVERKTWIHTPLGFKRNKVTTLRIEDKFVHSRSKILFAIAKVGHNIYWFNNKEE